MSCDSYSGRRKTDRDGLPLASPTSSHPVNGKGIGDDIETMSKGIRQENQLAILGTQVTPIYMVQDESCSK
jgi:hypothetical protein